MSVTPARTASGRALPRGVALGVAIAVLLVGQSVLAPPAWACHFLSVTTATLVPGGFTFEAQATTSADGNSSWTYEVASTTPSGLTPTVTWSVIDAYPDGEAIGSADPSTHGDGEGMRFFVSGLSAGDSVTVRAVTFIGANGDCTGVPTRYTRDVTGAVAEDGAPPPAPPAEPVAPAEPPALACQPSPARAGAEVTCVVTGGDPDLSILWLAVAGSEVGRAGVTLDDAGQGSFSFELPSPVSADLLSVELVEWGVSTTLPVAGPAPTVVAAGGAPVDGPVPLVGAVAFLLALIVVMTIGRRRRA